MIKNIRNNEDTIFYTENGVEKEAGIVSVSLFPEDYPNEVVQYLKKLDETEIESIPPENSIDIQVDTRIERVLSDVATDSDGIKVANVYKDKEVPIILDETVSFEEGIELFSDVSYHDLASECEDMEGESPRFIEARNQFYLNFQPVNYWYISKLTGEKKVIKRWKRKENTLINGHEIASYLGKGGKK